MPLSQQFTIIISCKERDSSDIHPLTTCGRITEHLVLLTINREKAVKRLLNLNILQCLVKEFTHLLKTQISMNFFGMFCDTQYEVQGITDFV